MELSITFSQNYVPIQITGANTLFQQVTFYGYSGFNVSGIPNNNTASYYVGKNSGNLYMNVSTGSYTSLSLLGSERESLNNFWAAGKINDQAFITYY